MRKVCAAMLSAAICLAVSGAPAWASEQQATLSAGYLHARTNAPGSDNLNGINVKYRYEFTDTLGLVTSFSYAGDRNRQLTRYSDIESLENRYADELLKLRPVWYRSTCERDRKDWGHYGLIAEEVGEIAPQYVHWRPLTDEDDPGIASDNGMVAEGVMYDRLVVPLIHHIQKLTKRVEELEAKLKLSEL